jgi:multidrug efflux system outer membrane protein
VGAEQKLMAANANIGVARAAYFPRISLTSSVGTASRNLGGLFDANSGAWSFQPTLSLPIFDAGRNTANVNLAVARKDIAIAEYEKVIQQAFREVADLLSARAKLKEQQEAQHANMTLQGQRLHLIEARYKAGIGSYGDVLDAERGLIGAQQNSLQIQHLIFSNATQLFKALAGDTASDEKK